MQMQGSPAQHRTGQLHGRAGAAQSIMRAGARQRSVRAGPRQCSITAAAGQCRLSSGAGRRCELTGDCQHPCGGVLALQCRRVTTSVCCEPAGAHARHTLQLATHCTSLPAAHALQHALQVAPDPAECHAGAWAQHRTTAHPLSAGGAYQADMRRLPTQQPCVPHMKAPEIQHTPVLTGLMGGTLGMDCSQLTRIWLSCPMGPK